LPSASAVIFAALTLDSAMKTLSISKDIRIPDPAKLAASKQAPAYGPRVLFFSGGSALRQLSHKLIGLTHNSVHILTPFDSGGSSAELRKAFAMPAIGDIRNRLVALTDQGLTGNPELSRLFASRLPKNESTEQLERRLAALLDGSHTSLDGLPESVRTIVLHHLNVFARSKPEDFDLRGASLGNLILTGGYLELGRQLEPVIHLYSKLADVRGLVRPVLDLPLHLTAWLENGQVIQGQHLLTGKQAEPIRSPVAEIAVSREDSPDVPVREHVSQELQALIASADLICFPMGSYYSSLQATLLPAGVGRSVARAGCPKIYLPSTGFDPETVGLSLSDQVERLIDRLLADCPTGTDPHQVLDLVVLDSDHSQYQEPEALEAVCRRTGVRRLDYGLVTPSSSPSIDPDRLIDVLISLAG
jgi:CofD-related protein of GAK system